MCPDAGYVFCLLKSLFLIDLNTLFPMVIASGPDILMTAIAPAPEGVAKLLNRYIT
jgi:hypothetical protein